MKLRFVKSRFLKRLGTLGLTLDTLTPAAGAEAMFSYYADQRVDGCELDADGDMLLFQWGTYDWGDGLAFEINITRQLILTDDDENTPRQLALAFLFPPAAAPKRLKPGNRWCVSPDGLPVFRRFVLASKTLKTLGRQMPAKVILRHGST